MKNSKKFMACLLIAAMLFALVPTVFGAELAPYVESDVENVLSTDFAWDITKYPESLTSATDFSTRVALCQDWGFTYGAVIGAGRSIDRVSGLGGKDATDTSAQITGNSSNVDVYFEKEFNGGNGYTGGIFTLNFKLYSDSAQYLNLRCGMDGGNKDIWVRASENAWSDHSFVIDLDNKKGYLDGQTNAIDMENNTLKRFRFILCPADGNMIAFDDLSITYNRRGTESISGNTITLNGTAAKGSDVKAYVNGVLGAEAENVIRDYSLSLQNLKSGRNIVTVEAKAPNGDVTAYTKIINVSGKVVYLAGMSKTANFNELPELTDARDTESFNTVKSMYGVTSAPNDATLLSRVSGASGKDGDYALYIEAYPGWKPTFKVGDDTCAVTTSGKVVYDFDLKVDNSNNTYWLMGCHDLWYTQNNFIGSGTLYTPAAAIPSGEWVHINMVYDLNDANGDRSKGKWYVTLTVSGVSSLVVNGKSPSGTNVYRTGQYFQLTNRDSGNFAIDNFSITNVIDNPYVEAVSYSIGGAAFDTNAVIPVNAESITFNMSDAVALTDGCLTLNGVAVPSDKITLDAASKAVTVQLSELKADSKLSFAGIVNADITVTDDKGYYCVPSISGTAYSAEIYGIAPNGSESLTVIIASYNKDNTMVSIDVKNVNIGAGSFVHSISSNIDAKAATTKTMIIDSIGSIVPLTKNR